MKSLLTALEEGRLVELPDTNKDKALEYLALLIEAIPDDHQGLDIVAEIKHRETTGNTALGKGIACPHGRRPGEGDLLCTVGWSPAGIDYGTPDGLKVHLVVMYLIPDSQRNAYLKEVSGLAKAAMNTDVFSVLSKATDLNMIRSQLLDWVVLATESAGPDSKARMVKLMARQAAAPGADRARQPLVIVPFSVVFVDASRPVVLSRDADFVRTMEAQGTLGDQVRKNESFELAGFQVIVRSVSSYAADRAILDCLAVKFQA